MSIFKVSTARQHSQVISLPERCATLVNYDDIQYTYNMNILVIESGSTRSFVN